MSYLILGSNSFAGSTLVDYLLTKGERVIGVNRSAEYDSVLQPYFHNKNKKNFTFYQCDINTDLDKITALLKQYKPQYIIDFAGQGMVAESWKNPEQWYQTNILAKIKLYEVIRHCDFLERYVRSSTPEVYGSVADIITEDCPYNPSTPYAVSHAATDMSLMAYHRHYGFPVTLTRFANFYGPHQQLYRIIPRTIIYALTGQTLLLHGGGHAERAFIHGMDVAKAIDLTIERGQAGEIYQFSTGDSISIRVLVEKICQCLNVQFDSLVQISEDRPGKDAKYAMSSDKARQDLAWEPSFSLIQGLEQTMDWIKKNLNIIKNLPLHYQHKE